MQSESATRTAASKLSRCGHKIKRSIVAAHGSKCPTSTLSLTVSAVKRIPAHDLAARRAARESRPKPWTQPKNYGWDAIPLSLTIKVDTTNSCYAPSTSSIGDWYTPSTGSSLDLSSPSPTLLKFASPLPEQLTTTYGTKFLKDFPAFEFFRYFLEPARTLDIPLLQKYNLANYLRQTAEVSCFDLYRRWMLEQADLIIVDGPDQLDLPAWIALLDQHNRRLPKEAFGVDFEGWMISACETIRHKAVHREDFTTDKILTTVRLALGLNNVQRAEKIQEAVKTMYDDLSSGRDPDYHFIDVVPNSPLPLKPQPNQFRMLYSILDLVCRKLFDRINLQSPNAFPGTSLKQLEYGHLQAWVETHFHSLMPGQESGQYIHRLTSGCRTLRNCVEHRNTINSNDSRALMKDAANLMLVIGDAQAACHILQTFRRAASEISNITPHDDLPRPILFLRNMKQLSCWQERDYSSQGLSLSGPRELIPRKHHPYRYCLRPIFDLLEPLIKKARKEEKNWAHSLPLYEGHFPKFERGLNRAYELTARWYDCIHTGLLEVDEVRSPTVESWDGKLGRYF
ncbi:MAG: hypothetical protein LQ343_007611 [Gyalolechia ehrenbergii]|nr:MAG: hypothetical protein LQ343_007611 [Gyalolechia ehrenbergii]